MNAKEIGRAWLALCLALSLHVADEAATGFLDVYNPAVAAIRERLPWLPLPVFRFEIWITGLIGAITVLLFLARFVYRGARWTRPVAYALAILMTANALGHTTGTLLGGRPMPGFYSSPLLFAASMYLLFQLRSHGLPHDT
jgi:hypothetical protein